MESRARCAGFSVTEIGNRKERLCDYASFPDRQPHRSPHHREAHFKNRQGAKRNLTELSAKLQTNPLTRFSFQRNGSGDFIIVSVRSLSLLPCGFLPLFHLRYNKQESTPVSAARFPDVHTPFPSCNLSFPSPHPFPKLR